MSDIDPKAWEAKMRGLAADKQALHDAGKNPDDEQVREFTGTTFPAKVEKTFRVSCEHQLSALLPPMTKDDGYSEVHVEVLDNGRQRHHYMSGPRRGQVFEQSSSGTFLRSPDEPVDRKPKQPNS